MVIGRLGSVKIKIPTIKTWVSQPIINSLGRLDPASKWGSLKFEHTVATDGGEVNLDILDAADDSVIVQSIQFPQVAANETYRKADVDLSLFTGQS